MACLRVESFKQGSSCPSRLLHVEPQAESMKTTCGGFRLGEGKFEGNAIDHRATSARLLGLALLCFALLSSHFQVKPTHIVDHQPVMCGISAYLNLWCRRGGPPQLHPVLPWSPELDCKPGRLCGPWSTLAHLPAAVPKRCWRPGRGGQDVAWELVRGW
jgi:hypothetical protein